MAFSAKILMVCPSEHRAEACMDAAYLSGNPSDAVPGFFSIPCAQADGGEVTHYAAVTLAREEVLAALPGLEASYPGCAWEILERGIDTPTHTTPYPRWQDALTALGFVQLEGEEGA